MGQPRDRKMRPRTDERVRRIDATIRPSLLERLDAFAAAQGVSRSAAMADLIASRLDQIEADQDQNAA